jgi:hypothetical protein
MNINLEEKLNLDNACLNEIYLSSYVYLKELNL